MLSEIMTIRFIRMPSHAHSSKFIDFSYELYSRIQETYDAVLKILLYPYLDFCIELTYVSYPVNTFIADLLTSSTSQQTHHFYKPAYSSLLLAS